MPIKDPAYLGKVKSKYSINDEFFPVTKPDAAVTTFAATATVTPAQFTGNANNTGASGTITLTLPNANLTLNQTLRMYLTAAQIVRFAPIATQGIYLAGSGVVNKYVQVAGVIGNYIDLRSDGSKYLVLQYAGVVTKEA